MEITKLLFHVVVTFRYLTINNTDERKLVKFLWSYIYHSISVVLITAYLLMGVDYMWVFIVEVVGRSVEAAHSCYRYALLRYWP
jgi:hypothetical protein